MIRSLRSASSSNRDAGRHDKCLDFPDALASASCCYAFHQTLDKHISVNHPEMLGKVALVLATLENPSIIASGNPGTNNLVFVNHEASVRSAAGTVHARGCGPH